MFYILQISRRKQQDKPEPESKIIVRKDYKLGGKWNETKEKLKY